MHPCNKYRHYLEILNSPVLKYTFLHVLRFINKLNYIIKCRIQSRYFVRKKEKEKNFRHIEPLFLGILTLIKINISLTNQNAASLSNMHPCNNVRVSGGIARGENDIDSHRIALSRDTEFACIEIYIFTCFAFH
jgi:hypothetical protein